MIRSYVFKTINCDYYFIRLNNNDCIAACTIIIIYNIYIIQSCTKIKLVFNLLYVCALIRSEAKRADILVLDQGLAQALWSTLYYGEARPAELTMNSEFKILLAAMMRDMYWRSALSCTIAYNGTL